MTSFLHHQVEKAILRLCEDLGTPTALDVRKDIELGRWDLLASRRVDPRHYSDALRYWLDATAVNVLRKCDDLPTTIDRKAKAEESFISCELQCLRANSRLFAYLAPGNPETDEHVLSYIKRVRKIIRRILGAFPSSFEGRFGPGATFADRGRLTTVPDKMTSEPTLTRDAIPYLFPWSGTLWAKALCTSRKAPTFVRGNRFTTVPKDSEKFRGIAVEPSINLFYQLGLGRIIRSRLKLAGISLAEGQDIHRRVAREASIRGHLATLDLSNASDTICRNLVKLLLPPEWYEALNDLRSPATFFKGKWRLLEKFSSMGNGFTFELETLLFLGMCLGVEREGQKLTPGINVFVYGDDIIIPSECSSDVISALSFFGLTVNKEKSFVDGPFRESCGGDYFLGVDVRPHFLKENPCEPQHLIAFANGLRRLVGEDHTRWQFIRRSWFTVLDGLPKPIRDCRGPSDLEDLVVFDPDETRWRKRFRSQIRHIQVYRPARFRKVALSCFTPDVVLATACYGLRNASFGEQKIIPRGDVLGYKVGWVVR